MTELPIVVNMTVDASRTEYDLTVESNLEEIELLNDTVIETGGSHVPVYEGPYTVDAGLNAVTLDTDGKRMTQDVTVNALTENYISGNDITVNANGRVSSFVSVSAGYSPNVFAQAFYKQLDTQARATITPTASEQTAVARNKYTLGAVKVRAISSPYADVSGVTATAGDVLSGKYFVNSNGVLTLGTATAGGGDGAPMPVETVAEMIDTTKVYLYVGSEAGYTFGNWYYYDGNDWVSGGKWGADGGVNTNARNLLQYILERVAYTETDMEPYVNALYEALAQAGTVTTDYTITNALTNVTNSNTATGCDEGDSYTGTLTADTDYTIDTATVTMGGVDITSTAYNNGVITIASVTGDIVITATATARILPIGYTQVSYISAPQIGTVLNGSTAQYIDLPYTASASNTYKLETEIKWDGAWGQDKLQLMAFNSFGYFGWQKSSGNYIIDSISENGSNTGITASTSDFDVISVELKPNTGNSITINGVTVNSARSTWTAGRTLCLFAMEPSNMVPVYPVKASMKYFNLYINDVLTMKMYACTRDSDGKAGLYDIISNTFYPSNGTADFTYTV